MSTTNTDMDYDVSIVGFGPVGAFAALLLAEDGYRVSIHERSTRALDLPRAVGLDGESLRAFQSLGLGDQVANILQTPRADDELWFTNSKHEKLFGQAVSGGPGHHGWRELAFFDQPELEALLRELVGACDRIDVFLGEEAVDVDATDDHVELSLRSRDGGDTRRVRSQFLIGADGASSFVRRIRSIPWTSLGYDQDWLVIDILIEPEADLPTQVMQICDPERLTTYICVKDPNRRWEFQLRPGETAEEMVRPEQIDALLADWLPPEHYTLRRAAVYQFHAATAEKWRDGRILLVGDAAHQTPPFLGQGLNSGFRDAFNLAWKLSLVLEGRCEASLLDRYFEERDGHARALVDGAVGIGKLMETLAAREAGLPDPYPEGFPGVQIADGRMSLAIEPGALLGEQAEFGFPIGMALRQPNLRPKDGSASEARLDEFIGRGFALIGRSAADLELGAEAFAVADRIGLTRIALDDYEITQGELDRAFEETSAILVRPDRNVFGVAHQGTSVDDLLVELSKKISLRKV